VSNELHIREKARESARFGMGLVMRFVYRELAAAQGDDELEAARKVQRLAVGLQRKLDAYRCAAAPPDPGLPGAHQVR
jgi:hypothetical protein